LSGAELEAFSFRNVLSGPQTLNLDVSALHRGTFLVQLVTDQQKQVKKIMKL
jgi:hypothetical protein